MRLYCLHDHNPTIRSKRGAFRVTREQAQALNQDGYGVFWTVNPMKGKRAASNVTAIRSWFIEMDSGTKEEQEAKLRACPLIPTQVVETRKGYHAYWKAVDGTLANWARIVRWGLIPALGGDPKSSDPSRILRVPGFLHWKDPANPFAVREVWSNPGLIYSEAQMLRFFQDQSPAERTTTPKELGPNATFWERVARIDGREAIERLSGHWLFNGERFRLDEQPSGTANIIREPDDYSTGCWVRDSGTLGGVEGGASIAAFCKWYGWSWSEVAEGLKEVFAEELNGRTDASVEAGGGVEEASTGAGDQQCPSC